MRITCRASFEPWNRWVALAIFAMVCVLLVLVLAGADEPVSARTPLADLASPPRVLPPVAPAVALAPQSDPVSNILLPRCVLAPVPVAARSDDMRKYQGKSYQYVKTLTLRVTAYAADRRCTFPYPGTTTSSGLPVTTNGGRLVAADASVIPLHWLVSVPGYASGTAVPVLDRGGAIKGNRLDVLLPTYEKAQSWGVRMLQVRIYQPIN